MKDSQTHSTILRHRCLVTVFGVCATAAAIVAPVTVGDDSKIDKTNQTKYRESTSDEPAIEVNKKHTGKPYNIVVSARIESEKTGDQGSILGIVYQGSNTLTVGSASVFWSQLRPNSPVTLK